MSAITIKQHSSLRSSLSVRPRILALSVAACFAVSPVFSPAWALPTGGQVVAGSAQFRQSGNRLVVANTPGAIINWSNFSVGAIESVRFQQQHSLSSVLNRVTGKDSSSIQGALLSNGRVFLINPNGILFGPNSKVDVGGLVASSLGIADEDFKAGRWAFKEGAGAGSVKNAGTVNAAGNIYLVGPDLENSGILRSDTGEVLLAAGRQVSLVDAAHPDIQVVVSAPTDTAVNLGEIVAGKVSVFGALVQQRGRVNADRVEVDEKGRIVFRASGDTIIDGGRVTANSSQGSGGRIEVLGNRVAVMGDAVLEASGAQGGGTILVGGDYQGKNPNIQNSSITYFGPDATLRANAQKVDGGGTAPVSGDGGKIVVWADDTARAFGSIEARGSQSGKGGFVETSGKRFLDVKGIRVDTAGGTWLLDPDNIDLYPGSGTDSVGGGVFTTGIFSGGSGTATLYGATIGGQLATNDVVLQAGPTAVAGAGNINIYGGTYDFSAAGHNLTLLAYGGGTAYGDITVTGGTVAFNMGSGNFAAHAGWDGASTTVPGVNTLGNGYLTATGTDTLSVSANHITLMAARGIELENPSLTATGAIVLTGYSGENSVSGVDVYGGTLKGASIDIVGVGGGTLSDGIAINGTRLESTGSGIQLSGDGGIGQVSYGITLDSASIEAYGSGSIDIYGIANLSGAGLQDGIDVFNTTIKANGGEITLFGTAGAGYGSYGIWLDGSTKIEGGGGDIYLIAANQGQTDVPALQGEPGMTLMSTGAGSYISLHSPSIAMYGGASARTIEIATNKLDLSSSTSIAAYDSAQQSGSLYLYPKATSSAITLSSTTGSGLVINPADFSAYGGGGKLQAPYINLDAPTITVASAISLPSSSLGLFGNSINITGGSATANTITFGSNDVTSVPLTIATTSGQVNPALLSHQGGSGTFRANNFYFEAATININNNLQVDAALHFAGDLIAVNYGSQVISGPTNSFIGFRKYDSAIIVGSGGYVNPAVLSMYGGGGIFQANAFGFTGLGVNLDNDITLPAASLQFHATENSGTPTSVAVSAAVNAKHVFFDTRTWDDAGAVSGYGGITIASGKQLTAQTGGSLYGNLTNHGTVQIGDATHFPSLTVETGSFTQSATGLLRLFASGSNYSSLYVAYGNATLDGGIEVLGTGNGSTLIPISANSISGDFSTKTTSGTDPVWTKNSTTYTLILGSNSYDRYWDGEGGDGKWSTLSNWSGNALPGSTEAVGVGNYAVLLDMAASIKSLSCLCTLSTAYGGALALAQDSKIYTLNLVSGSSVTAHGNLALGSLAMTGGTLQGKGQSGIANSLLVGSSFSQTGGTISAFNAIGIRQQTGDLTVGNLATVVPAGGYVSSSINGAIGLHAVAGNIAQHTGTTLDGAAVQAKADTGAVTLTEANPTGIVTGSAYGGFAYSSSNKILVDSTTVTVPDATQTPISLVTSGISSQTGNINLWTSYGGIEIASQISAGNTSHGGDIYLEADAGDVTVTGPIQAAGPGGTIHLDSWLGKVTTSGSGTLTAAAVAVHSFGAGTYGGINIGAAITADGDLYASPRNSVGGYTSGEIDIYTSNGGNVVLNAPLTARGVLESGTYYPGEIYVSAYSGISGSGLLKAVSSATSPTPRRGVITLNAEQGISANTEASQVWAYNNNLGAIAIINNQANSGPVEFEAVQYLTGASPGSTNISLTNYGDTTVPYVVSSNDGTISITANSPLTIAPGATVSSTSGGISLTAANGGAMTINGSVSSSSGAVSLAAGSVSGAGTVSSNGSAPVTVTSVSFSNNTPSSGGGGDSTPPPVVVTPPPTDTTTGGTGTDTTPGGTGTDTTPGGTGTDTTTGGTGTDTTGGGTTTPPGTGSLSDQLADLLGGGGTGGSGTGGSGGTGGTGGTTNQTVQTIVEQIETNQQTFTLSTQAGLTGSGTVNLALLSTEPLGATPLSTPAAAPTPAPAPAAAPAAATTPAPAAVATDPAPAGDSTTTTPAADSSGGTPAAASGESTEKTAEEKKEDKPQQTAEAAPAAPAAAPAPRNFCN